MSSRFKGPDAEENVACNLIPMIDIMFLLLLFFMLGADMTQRELEDVVLPKADQAKQESDYKDPNAGGRTTVNVFHRHSSTGVSECAAFGSGQVCRNLDHWMMAIRAKYETLDTIVKALEEEAKLEIEEVLPDGKSLSRRHVHIRADENAPYGYIQRVIESCAAAGIYRIEVAAAQPEPAG